jgi:hypothetical protein
VTQEVEDDLHIALITFSAEVQSSAMPSPLMIDAL